MLLLPRAVRVYVATKPVRLNRSFDGLSNVVREVLGHDPLSGHVFVFINRRRTMVKLLVWTRGGSAAASRCCTVSASPITRLGSGPPRRRRCTLNRVRTPSGACSAAVGQRERFGHFELAVPVVHPLFKDAVARLLGISRAELDDVLDGVAGFDGDGRLQRVEEVEEVETGGTAIHAALAAVDLDELREAGEVETARLARSLIAREIEPGGCGLGDRRVRAPGPRQPVVGHPRRPQGPRRLGPPRPRASLRGAATRDHGGDDRPRQPGPQRRPPFQKFPNYKTMGANRRSQLRLTPDQIRLLASLCTHTVLDQRALFEELLT